MPIKVFHSTYGAGLFLRCVAPAGHAYVHFEIDDVPRRVLLRDLRPIRAH